MAKINVTAAPGGGGGGSGTVTSVGVTSSTLTVTGSPVTTSGTIVANIPDGFLKVGTGVTGTLQNVVDTNGTATQLFLSSTGIQATSKIQITTADTNYIDAEDNSGNNRFTVGRDPSSQLVTVDFASVPTALTTPVGAIRTATDGVNLANIQTFLENGAIGFGTDTPDTNALIDITSTTKGFLPPRMTNAQRAAITATKGLIVVNTTNNAIAYNDGTNWGYLSGAKQTATGTGTLSISFASGNIIDLTLTASTTLTFTAHVVGTYIIQVTQGGSGSYTLTYPASVKWSGGTAPTLTTTVGKTDILTFYHDGTSFYGTYSLNY